MPRHFPFGLGRGAGILGIGIACCVRPAGAADRPQWGEQYTRNMISEERGLPVEFDLDEGRNVKWVATLGTSTYSTPVVAHGRILIGTNNGEPRDPRRQGDRGVLMCFNESDGAFLWQWVVPKLTQDRFLDWPGVGMVSPATVDGDRVYMVNNRGEVVCLDLNGLVDGNDGPYRDEARHAVPPEDDPLPLGAKDADILWLYPMRTELGIRQHDSAHCSVLVHGPFLYICTSNGVDGTHRVITAPQAPSLVVLNKESGQLVATDDEKIGPDIVHSTWSSPSVGTVAGRELVFFGGGDGVCYAFAALDPSTAATASPLHLKKVWEFDCDPEAPKTDIHSYQGNRRKSPSNIVGMPVLHNNRIFIAAGGDYWHGKIKTWLKCIDATGEGDITATGEVWSTPLQRHCFSTPAIFGDLTFITDLGKSVYCLDTETGRPHWIHELDGEAWASPLVADGKVYVGSQRGDFWVLEASSKLEILNRVQFPSAINATPVAANGVLYVTDMMNLYALAR